MSEESKMIEPILKNLLSPNNEERRKNEAQILELIKKNKIGLVLCLTQILNSSQEKEVVLYAAVISRKLLVVPENQNVNQNWVSAPNDIKEQIKTNLINALVKFTDKFMKKKIVDIIGVLYQSISKNEEKWEQVLKYIVEGFKLPLNSQNDLNIGSAVLLLSKIFRYATKDLTPGIDVFISGFDKYFQEGSIDLQTTSVEAICELLSENLGKKNTKKFKDLIFYILKTILKCLEANDADNLKINLFALSNLSQFQSAMLKKNFSDLTILMSKIIDNKELDEDQNLREVAFEIIVSVIEGHHDVISKDQEKLKALINSIFKYSMEIDETIDDEWLTPKSTSLSSENYIPEPKLDEALSLIDRIVLACKESKKTLPIISGCIIELLNHKNESWKFKYIAYVSVGKIATHIDEIKEIEDMVKIILKDINSENPKIRYACLYCISEFASNLKDEFTELYGEEVIPQLCNLVKNEKVLRCKLQGYDTLETFIEESSEELLAKYLQGFLDALYINLLKPATESPQSLKEAILDCLGGLIDKSKKSFSSYSERSFNLMAEYFGNSLKNNDYSDLNLFGLYIENLTKIGEDCPELLEKSTKDIASALITFQNNIKNFKGDVSSYLVASWERILPYVKKNCTDLIPKIIESIITVIEKPPEMSIDSNPDQVIDIQEFLKDADSKGVELEKKKLSIVTSETEEYSVFIDLLNLILTELKEHALPCISAVDKRANSILNYPNIDIRGKAASIFPKIVDIVFVSGDKERLSLVIKNYLSVLVEKAINENENEVISYLLNAVEDCIKDHGRTLTQDEVNSLFYKLFAIFDRVEKNRIQLGKEENIKIEEVNRKTKEPKDEDIDDYYDEEIELDNIKQGIEGAEDIITSFSDAIGALFKTHKEFCMEITLKMINDVLPKYFENNASNFEKKMGLFILDDMVEFLGQELLSNIWPNIFRILITYVDNPSCEIRQAASYGLGEFIKHTNTDYSKYAKDILDILERGLKIQMGQEQEDEFHSAQDNIVTAIGKIILYRKNEYSNLKEIIQVWLDNLPITGDLVESAGQHDLLCDTVINTPDMIFGENNKNVPMIMRILCKIVGTKYSNEEVDKKIKVILEGMKNNKDLVALVPEAKKGASDKVKKKIKQYLEN